MKGRAKLNRIKLIASLCTILVVLAACSKSSVQPQPKKETISASGPVVVGISSSCDIAPKQLTLAGKTYHLSDNAISEEGPMKLAYIKCEKGTFTMGEPDDAFVIFSAGKTSDIYLAGGRTEKGLHQFYSLEEATQSPANQKSGK
jgi:hypothetical protein